MGAFADKLQYKPIHLYKGGVYEYHQNTAEEGLKLDVNDYDDKAKIWHNIFRQHLPKKEELSKTSEGITPVLELGCNTAYSTKEYEKMYGFAIGIDSNERLIKESKINHSRCYVMRAEWLRFEDDAFSAVFAKDVYEHCQYPDKAIESTYRVLTDGGYVVAMIPLDGDFIGIDDVVLHDSFNFNNKSHTWKATLRGVISRFLKVGFTDLELWVYTHSQLFGVAREYGDNVAVIRAKKVKNIIKVPDLWLLNNAYWGAFITFACTGNCDYCIQYLSSNEFVEAKKEYNKDMLKPEEWVDFYNKAQKWKGHRLGIIGGEPTIYPGFFEVVNGIEGYYKTITTNLESPIFEDVKAFSANIVDKNVLRINTSFHPRLTNVDEFSNKIFQLREQGFNVDQIAMVDHPTSNFKKYYYEFINKGLVLQPQTYLGRVGEELLPNANLDYSSDHGEHGIDNFELYKEGFSYKEKKDIMCMTGKFLVSPNGGIYKCHYHLYSNRNSLGNIKDGVLPRFDDYSICSDFGFCNPCDFPNVRFKPTLFDTPSFLLDLTKDERATKYLLDVFNDKTDEEFKQMVRNVIAILYSNTDPYWALYNDDRIREVINAYLYDGSIWDNSKELMLAQFDFNMFGYFDKGINIYRMLDDVQLLKYMDALGFVIYTILINNKELCNSVLKEPFLIKALDTFVSKTHVTYGTSHFSNGSFIVMRKEEYAEEENNS